MAANKTQLTGADILDKDFKTAFRGYKQEEVDEFLDTIIRDYEAMQQDISQLKQENEQLKNQSDSSQEQAAPQHNQQVNYDILKRVSNLEKAVFGKQNRQS